MLLEGSKACTNRCGGEFNLSSDSQMVKGGAMNLCSSKGH